MPGPPAPSAGAAAGAWQNYQPPGERLSGQGTEAPRPAHRAQWGHYDKRPPWKDQEPEMMDWQGLRLLRINKSYHEAEHPRVQARTQEECEQIRLENSINMWSETLDVRDLPKPLDDLEEAPFPDSVYATLRDRGFSKPTPIQVQAWPVLLKCHDLVGIAETGSGKTLAYVPPMVVHILSQPDVKPGEGPVGIVLVPTRELCFQVQSEIEACYADFTVQAVCGGSDISEQQRKLLETCNIVVATPGRLIHILNMRYTNLLRATFLVLDEADGLLEEGFEEQIRLILKNVRPDRQVCLFSATWPPRMEELAKDVCAFQPVHINVGSTRLSACKNIEQLFFLIGNDARSDFPGMSKLDLAHQMMSRIQPDLSGGWRALIFCNKQGTVNEVAQYLQERGHSCQAITSAMRQEEREQVLQEFVREGSGLHFLVSTQMLGRGHDFPRLLYVMNFDMPRNMVEYVHRIGRSGRAGAKGIACTLMEERDLWMARPIWEVLKESSSPEIEQRVPQFIIEASSNKKQKEYRNMRWHRPQATEVVQAAPPYQWNGRGGVGRVEEFRRESGAQGWAQVL